MDRLVPSITQFRPLNLEPRNADKGTGGGGANLESGLDNSPVTQGVPFNETGLYLQDEYDAGYTGMFLMDCQAQMALAKMIGRADAITTLQQRFETVARVMPQLWNATEGMYQNKRSKDLAPIERMAPTHFYPLLAGPTDGPTEEQAKTMIQKHLTNPKRFAVWPVNSSSIVQLFPVVQHLLRRAFAAWGAQMWVLKPRLMRSVSGVRLAPHFLMLA